MFKIKIVNNDRSECKFFCEIPIELSNSIRRICIAETPTIALDLCSFNENDTITHDQYLANRLAFIPIKTDLNSIRKVNYHNNCKCDDKCNFCCIPFKLEAKNNMDNPMDVTSTHIQYKDKRFIPMENIPITILEPKQCLSFFAYARKGIGKMHPKWSPVSIVTFNPIAKIETDINDFEVGTKREFAKVCHKNIFRVDDDGEARINDIEECTFCERCVRYHKNISVSITESPIKICTIESTGQMKAHEVYVSALDVLVEKCKKLLMSIDTMLPE